LKGLSIINDGLSVVLSKGLDFDSSGGISVQLGSGLQFNGNEIQISNTTDLFGVSTITNDNGGLVLVPANGTSSTVDIGISLAPLKGLSIINDGLSVVLSKGLDFDTSGGISVQLGSGLEFNTNNIILNPPKSRMYYTAGGVSETVVFNAGDIIYFDTTSGDDYLSGTSAFHPPLDGFYNSSVHLFNGASAATSGSILALQDDTGAVLQRYRTYGMNDISFSGIFGLSSGTSYSLTVESGANVDIVLGDGYSEWSTHYISRR